MKCKMNIFDAHSDLWEDVDEKRRRGLDNIIRRFHLPNWKTGQISGGIYPIWVDPFGTAPPAEQALSIIENMSRELKQAGSIVQVVTSAEQYIEAEANGRHAMFLGAEGLSFLEDPSGLEKLYGLGLRCIGLTWNEDNRFASGSDGDGSTGLSPLGIRCIQEMKRLGMLLDLAHAGEKSFWQALDIWDRPLIVSHCGCRALCDRRRNLSDEQIRAIAELDGVVGICAYAPFLSDIPENSSTAVYARHVAHVAELVGTEHVGLGFDLVDFLDDFGTDPSISYTVKGFENISHAQQLLAEIRSLGFSEQEMAQLCSGNFLRVIKETIA